MAEGRMKDLFDDYCSAVPVFLQQSKSVISLIYDLDYIVVAHNPLFSDHVLSGKSAVGKNINLFLMPESQDTLAKIEAGQEKQCKILFMATKKQPLSFECHIFRSNGHTLIIGEKLMLSNDTILQKMGALNSELVNLTRELQQKNRELESALELKRLKELYEKESQYLREEINLQHNYKNIIGNSNAIKYVLFKIEQVAETEATVIVLGETGTGKELFARAIHHNSKRKKRPLIKLNCAALPANLIESELFGHERGSYTGATTRHIGRFEVADKSTIFLDEVGELPLELQAKLLRVIEDGEFERLGSSKTLKVDVRIIAATNRDLEKDSREGRFRQDLWYRLNVFPISLPPLRDRIEDIPLIVQHFVNIFSRKLGKNIVTVPAHVIAALQDYNWPGNVRELENIIERAIISTSGSKLSLSEKLVLDDQNDPAGFRSLRDMERNYIIEVLNKTNWKVSGQNSAAEILQLERGTLRAKMKKLSIHKPSN
jgi:formate hydrogenlyase transcriptional activator